MATIDTQGFIEKARQAGISDDKINQYLQKKGLDPNKQSQDFQTGFRGFATGVGKELTKTAVDTAGMLIGGGRYIQAAIDPFNTVQDYRDKAAAAGGKGSVLGDVSASFVQGTPQYERQQRQLTPTGAAEKAGATTAFVGELATPLVSNKVRALTTAGTKAITRGAGKTIGGAGSKTSEAIFGTEGRESLREAFSNPKLQREVIQGKITPSTIADKAKSAALDFRTQSIKALDDYKQGMENFNIGKRTAMREINGAIKKAVGLADEARVKFDNLPITQESERILGKLQQTVLGHKDWSRKGVLELRELIDRQKFYKAGNKAYTDSNQVVTAVRNSLNDLAAAGDDTFREVLTKASDDIRFLEQLGVNVLGKNRNNVTLTASKINTLLKEITDPGTKTRALELLQRLANETGSPIIKELEALARSRSLTKPITGIRDPFTTGGQLLERGAAATTRVVGDVVGAGRRVLGN